MHALSPIQPPKPRLLFCWLHFPPTWQHRIGVWYGWILGSSRVHPNHKPGYISVFDALGHPLVFGKEKERERESQLLPGVQYSSGVVARSRFSLASSSHAILQRLAVASRSNVTNNNAVMLATRRKEENGTEGISRLERERYTVERTRKTLCLRDWHAVQLQHCCSSMSMCLQVGATGMISHLTNK